MKLLYLFIFLNVHNIKHLDFTKNQNTNQQIDESFLFRPLINYKSALLAVKKSNKKLFIYFTSYGSVNSIRMEEDSFTNLEVKLLLDKNYVCFKAYLDDQTAIPINDQYVSKALNKKVKTVGEKFQDLQLTKFKDNRQPHFLIIDKNEKVIRQVIGYQNKKEFISFLKIGGK